MLHVHESSCVSARVFLKIGMSIKMNTARFEVWHLFFKKPLCRRILYANFIYEWNQTMARSCEITSYFCTFRSLTPSLLQHPLLQYWTSGFTYTQKALTWNSVSMHTTSTYFFNDHFALFLNSSALLLS